jgi:outer membrane protein OmpA-like peptidoglycan-associated protein
MFDRMKNTLTRTTLAAAGLALLAGCTGTQLQKAETMPAEGTTFQRNLHDGYMNLARDEYDEGDYVDSDHFAMRAMDLAGGKTVQPEMIGSRSLPSDKTDDLTQARLRLMTAMAAGAAEAKPLPAAEAQVSFDCWMQEQEENFQPQDIAACRDRFMTAMAALEAQPEVAAAPPPAPEPMMAPGPFTVYFAFDDAGLTPDARAVLADVAEAARKSDAAMVNVSGFTDLSGSAAYNQVLSEQRANSVINFLVDSGVEAGKIVGRGLGETNPVVATEAPELRNRRVEIKLEPQS